MITRIFLGSCMALLIIGFGCHNGNPISSIIQPMTLTVEEVSCTQVWLNISVDNVAHPIVTLERNSAIFDTIFMTTTDTTVVDANVKAGQTYNYTARLLNNSFTRTVQIKTLDSTSHAITWHVDTLGAEGYVNDVWIFNKDSALAVGQIYLNNANGQSDKENPYSIARWNGQNWRLQKIYDNNNQIIPELQGIFSFSGTDIWLADGGVHHWDGISSQTSASYGRIALIGGVDNGQSIAKLWGTSSNNIYGVGYKGMIAHFNGFSWTKIKSNTTVDLQDIWGTDANHIWATGTNDVDGHSVVLQCDGTNWTTIYDSATQPVKMQFAFTSLWTDIQNKLWLVGETPLRQWNLSTNLFTAITTGQGWISSCIRGTAENDIFIVGQVGECAHFNGISWYIYPDLKAMNNGSALVLFLTVCPTQNFVALGGQFFTGSNGFPVVMRGYR